MTAIYAISIKNKNKNYFYCGMRAQNSQAYASFSPYVCIYYLCKTIDDAKKEINHINKMPWQRMSETSDVSIEKDINTINILELGVIKEFSLGEV